MVTLGLIQVICFSKDRPLQLHGYLTSLFKQWSGDYTVSVLVKSESPYQGAYAEVAAEFPQVEWCGESEFGFDLTYLLTANDAEFTCFGCDDAVYVAPVETNQVGSVFDKLNPLGVSLRLGENVLSDMFGADLYQPDFADWYEWRYWQFREGVGDWGYPWEVLGTVYRTDFVKSMVSTLNAGSPSQLNLKRQPAVQDDHRVISSYLPGAEEVHNRGFYIGLASFDDPEGTAYVAEVMAEFMRTQ